MRPGPGIGLHAVRFLLFLMEPTSRLDLPVDPASPQEAVPGNGSAAPIANGDEKTGPALIEAVLKATEEAAQVSRTHLDEFLNEPSPWKALVLWLGVDWFCRRPVSKEALARRLNRDVAYLDRLLNRQVNAIIHCEPFQRLEASWRGLRYLVEQVEEGQNVKVRILNLSWRELVKDLERALEFDHSRLFQKVYTEEFGTPGGEPFGVLLGDYEIRHRPEPEYPHDDIGALVAISQVAAAAFAPFIAGVHPSMLELDSFTDLERPLNLARTFEHLNYLKWRAFRRSEDARFVGLTLPRVLLRPPYPDTPSRADGFRFREEVGDPSRRNYLWGTAVHAFGGILIRAFIECGWLADIRGVRRGSAGSGLVTGFPTDSFRTDKPGLIPKCITDVIITDYQEKELGELGFIPLCHCPDTDLAAFYGNQSTQKPEKYDNPLATTNARLSAMLQYMLCVSRFAHYLKVLGRDKVGSFASPSDCESFLQRWLHNYLMADDEAGMEIKAKYPLREARVQVKEQPSKPGSYLVIIHLRPHYQLDQMVSSVRLATELSTNQPG